MKFLLLLTKLFALLIIYTSCGNPKALQYVQGPFDSTKYGGISYKEPVIKSGDILGITVYSDNPTASALYNQASLGSPTPGSAGASASGYLVDNNGDIVFHSIGNVHVKGLTRGQVAALLTEKLKQVLQNPYCQVRYNNFRITVLGEVKNPSVFSIPSERISLLEVIGLAGDLTPYGRRDSVLIIRELENERKFGWIDLRKTDIFSSDYFYLQQNDVVVVHPSKKKSAIDDQVTVRNIGILLSIVSTAAIVITIIQNSN